MKRLHQFGIFAAIVAAMLSFASCEEIGINPGDDTGGTEQPDNPDKPGPEEPEPEEPGPDEPGDEFEETVIFYDNLDKTVASGNTWNNFPGAYANPTGTGAVNVSYSASARDVSVRASYPSKGYNGASGDNNVYFGNNGSISISGIALDAGADTYELSFGSYQYEKVLARSDLRVYIKCDGGRNTEVEWTRSEVIAWTLASAVLKFEGTVPDKVEITFTAGFSGKNNIRIDDIRLVTSDKTPTQTITSGGGTADDEKMPYAELPNTLKANADYKYVTHKAETYKTKQYVRNYSACYDTRRHNPVWVAYPHHNIYREGGYTRPKPDPWRPDPEFDASEQSIIYADDYAGWPWSSNGNKPTEPTQYWSEWNGFTFTKGHMLKSADRGAGRSDVLFDMNVQTFYPTNISPENHKYPKHWEQIEYIMPNDWVCSDTLYCVTGCYYANDNCVVEDDRNWGDRTDKSKDCVVPTAHYKVFLRTKDGDTGKPVHKCSADELMAIGFWFEQNLEYSTNNYAGYQPALSTVTFSVAKIEEMLGGEFDFFPNVPDEVKDSYNVSDWPGLSDIIDLEYPAEN